MKKKRSPIEQLNNHEINNRLTNLVLPNLQTQTFQFTNDIGLIEHFLISFLTDKKLLSNVLEELSKSEIKNDCFRREFCINTLIILVDNENNL